MYIKISIKRQSVRDIKPFHIQSIVKDAGFGGTYPIIVKALYLGLIFW